jgi:hypothetical protein
MSGNGYRKGDPLRPQVISTVVQPELAEKIKKNAWERRVTVTRIIREILVEYYRTKEL